MRMRDSREVNPDKADLAALVGRIHENLRKERKARRPSMKDEFASDDEDEEFQPAPVTSNAANSDQ